MTVLAHAVHPEPEGERDVIVASPTDPRVEYLDGDLRRVCRCPSVAVVEDNGEPVHRTKILHAWDCAKRGGKPALVQRAMACGGGDAISRYLADLPRPIPCPVCGNVAFSLVGGQRRCTGPKDRACGHTWTPGRLGIINGED